MAKAFNDDKSKVEVTEKTIVDELVSGQLKLKTSKQTNITVPYNNSLFRYGSVPSGTVAVIPVITGSNTAINGVSYACSFDAVTNKRYNLSIAMNRNSTWNGDITVYILYTGEDDS